MKKFLLFLICYPVFASYSQGSGKALRFVGNATVEVADNATLDFGSGDFSYELWFKPTVAAPGAPLKIMEILVKRSNASIANFELQMGNNGILVAILGGAGGEFNALYCYESGIEGVGPPVILETAWYHVCFTRKNNIGNIYLNGRLCGSKSMPGDVSSTAKLNLAADLFDPGFSYYSGDIDEVRIWNRALSQDEIRHRMCQKLTGTEPGLVAYYRMDEGADNTCTASADVCDASGNGNHGTKR